MQCAVSVAERVLAGAVCAGALAKGRGYYLLPAYPVLYAAGAGWVGSWRAARARVVRGVVYGVVVAAVLAECGAIAWTHLPIWRPGSAAWKWQMKNNSDMANEVGGRSWWRRWLPYAMG